VRVVEPADVLEIVAMLEQAGVHLWIDGGWGVDALLGEQTRDHADLDLVVELADADVYERAVADAGFEFLYHDPANDRDGRHLNWVVQDNRAREIDVHLVDTTVECVTPPGVRVYGAMPYPVGSLDGTGTIAGAPVRCITAEYHMVSHTGYEIGETDIHDVLALHDRFGLPLPSEYASLAG
jgi:lincosamide nucleotidyltransferase A/C/D/E